MLAIQIAAWATFNVFMRFQTHGALLGQGKTIMLLKNTKSHKSLSSVEIN